MSRSGSDRKPIASLSLDLDNQWSYMKIHGDKGWEEYPSYLDIFIPHVLEVLDELDLKITFFIVGQDASREENKKYLEMITDHGHEVGNHSFNHESWLHLYPKDEIEAEIFNTEEAVESATGEKPIGFRGPGFSWSQDLLNVLYENDYLYDASTLPTYIGPLARMYYFWKSDLTKEERKDRKKLFGTFKDGFRSVKPYYWNLGDERSLLEIPVTTIPFFKTPFHLSYLLYLTGYSEKLMKMYLNTALLMCRISGISPSFLLHPLDLIGGDKLSQLAFFPGMSLKSNYKARVFSDVIKALRAHFVIENMSGHALGIADKKEGESHTIVNLYD